MHRIEEKNRVEKARDLFKETGDIKGTCHVRIGMIKDRNGFTDSSVGKESTCNAGDPGSTPGSGGSRGEGIGYPLQYSWAFLLAQLVKNPPAMQDTWVQPLDW